MIGTWTSLAAPWWWLGVEQQQPAAARTSSKQGQQHTIPTPAEPGPALLCCLNSSYTHRRPTYDLDKMPGPWRKAMPVVGNILECLRPDFHRVILK